MSPRSLPVEPAPREPVSSTNAVRTPPPPVEERAAVPLQTFPPPSHTDLDVTILMPCLNEARTLPACIESALAALQTLAERSSLRGEILISDNGSNDGSPELAERLGARVVHCPVRGYGAALRFGALSARGRYI